MGKLEKQEEVMGTLEKLRQSKDYNITTVSLKKLVKKTVSQFQLIV